MSIEKLEVFASQADKNTDGITLKYGFPSAEKPARQWFNWLFYTQTSKINEVADLANSNFTRVKDIDLKYEQLKRDTTKQLQDTASSLQDVRDYADQLMQTAVGGKLAYKTYAAMVADKANITANSSIDIIADTDDKNGTYLYDGTNFVKSNYDLENIIRSKVQNTFGTYNEMVEKGGALKDKSYALVADDTVNNGLYVKTAGAWVKSDYDPLTQAKAEATIKANAAEANANDFTVSTIVKKIASSRNKRQALTFSDKDGNTLGYFDDESDLRLYGIKNSVQESLNVTALDHKKVTRYISNHFNVADTVYPQLMNLMTVGKPIAPVPLECVPTSWTPSNDIINLKITQPTEHILIDTPYENPKEGRVVHPTLIQFKDSFMGYRYIMGLTPYFDSKERFENPVLYGSNNLINFDMLAPAPLADQPIAQVGATGSRYNSDIFLTYDYHTGELVCGWREYSALDTSGLRATFKAKRTKNLIDWSEEEVLYTGNVGAVDVAPAIVYNFKTKMYDLYFWRSRIYRYSSPSLQKPDWVQTASIAPTTPNFTPWHIDVRYIGNKLICVMHEYNETKGNLWTGISSDNGDTWTWATSALLEGAFAKPYKASVIPVFNEDGTYALHYIWTSANYDSIKTNNWKLYIQATTNINIEG